MLAAVQAIGRRPLVERLFPVKPCKPDAATLALLSAQMVSKLKQQSGCRAAIVRTDVILQRVVGVVVQADHHDAILRPRIFSDDVVEREFAGGSLRREGIVFDGVALQVGRDVTLFFFMPWRPWGAAADSDD